MCSIAQLISTTQRPQCPFPFRRLYSYTLKSLSSLAIIDKMRIYLWSPAHLTKICLYMNGLYTLLSHQEI